MDGAGAKDPTPGVGLVYQVDYCTRGIARYAEAVTIAFLPDLLIAQDLAQNTAGGLNLVLPQTDAIKTVQLVLFRHRATRPGFHCG